MLSLHASRRAVGLLVLLSFASVVCAQWPSSAATNLPLGDGAAEQVVNKIAATSDGGCYVGWFGNQNGSYAVWLQRLDAAGVEQWPHGGVLVSGNPQSSSLVDWDLICDSADHCVLAFTDTRAGGELDVYAYRVDPTGAQTWGANGLTLSNNSDYEPNPRVCEAGDGDFVVVWPNTVLRTIQMQRISPAGALAFAGDGIAIPGETGATPGFARVVAGAPGTGDVIVSWVRTTAFSGNKHVHAQKYDALGNALWNGGTRVAVFDQASVPIAHEPRLLADGSGGAIVGWHFAAGSVFSVRAQRLLANGTEAFVHNGVEPTTSANSEFDPALVWAAATSELFVAWNERNVGQTNWGIFAQKLDAAGVATWTPTGVQLLPVDTTEKTAPAAAARRAGAQQDGIAISVLVNAGGVNDTLQVFGLDGSGAAAFAPVVASSVVSDKLRLVHGSTASGTQLVVWTDKRSGNSDVFAAAVDLTGAVGVQIATATVGACAGNPAGSLVVSGRPAVGTTVSWQLANPLATQSAGSVGVSFVGFGAIAFPCGVPVPGFGMAGPGALGDVVIDLGQPNTSVLGGTLGSGIQHALSVPFAGSLLGVTLYVQGLVVDFAPAAVVPFGLTEAAQLVIGS